MISSGILGLVLLGVYASLSFALKWHTKMEDSVDTYQQAFKASTRLSYDLGTGSQTSFIYELYGPVRGLAFASARPDNGRFQIDSSGQLLWQRHIIYYIEDDTFYRNEVPFPTPAPVPPATPDLPTLKSQMTGKGAVMAENISDLEILPGSGASIRFKVTGDQTDKPNSMTLESRVTFRQ